jgi:hypothetical protein
MLARREHKRKSGHTVSFEGDSVSIKYSHREKNHEK